MCYSQARIAAVAVNARSLTKCHIYINDNTNRLLKYTCSGTLLNILILPTSPTSTSSTSLPVFVILLHRGSLYLIRDDQVYAVNLIKFTRTGSSCQLPLPIIYAKIVNQRILLQLVNGSTLALKPSGVTTASTTTGTAIDNCSTYPEFASFSYKPSLQRLEYISNYLITVEDCMLYMYNWSFSSYTSTHTPYTLRSAPLSLSSQVADYTVYGCNPALSMYIDSISPSNKMSVLSVVTYLLLGPPSIPPRTAPSLVAVSYTHCQYPLNDMQSENETAMCQLHDSESPSSSGSSTDKDYKYNTTIILYTLTPHPPTQAAATSSRGSKSIRGVEVDVMRVFRLIILIATIFIVYNWKRIFKRREKVILCQPCNITTNISSRGSVGRMKKVKKS